ncbi:MAG: TonB family protein [Myxococcota bacterium]
MAFFKSQSPYLPSESVGALVRPEWGDPGLGASGQDPAPAVPARAPSDGGIGWEVLSTERVAPTGRVVLAGIITSVGLHTGGAKLIGGGAQTPLEAQRSVPMVVVEHGVDLTPPPMPEPEPVKPPPPPPSRPAPRTALLAKRRPPAPAQAGEVVASESEAKPVDFTSFDITTGKGPRYAGGTTASSGTNTEAVHTRTVDPNARPDQPQGEASLARSVSLSARDWKCPWPHEAESLAIDEQTVILRAVVGPDGKASSVDILADPGHGFGQAALGCARNASFEPATDRQGRAYASTSPPIRVRFTR